jgi:hypothetical protein
MISASFPKITSLAIDILFNIVQLPIPDYFGLNLVLANAQGNFNSSFKIFVKRD